MSRRSPGDCGTKADQLSSSRPGAEPFFGFNHNHIVFLEHGNMILFKVLSKKFSFVELIPKPFSTLQIGKSMHEEKRVVIFHREKWPDNFHPDFLMFGQALRFE